MRTLGETVLLAGLVLALAPLAHAQGEEADPDVNESDFDTGSPAYDEQYLDEEDASDASGGSASSGEPTGDAAATEADPTLSEDDLDVGVPADDTSYLDDAEAEYAAEGASAGAGGDAPTPGPGLLVGLAVLGLAALALRRR